jgi:hypothetical protein
MASGVEWGWTLFELESGSEAGIGEFFNSLDRPYSITYAERAVKHCLPRVLRSERVIKMFKIRPPSTQDRGC